MSQLQFAVQFVVLTVAGRVNRRRELAIDCLPAENRVLRDQLGNRRLRRTDAQRRRLAVRGKLLGREALEELAGLVPPETILRWVRNLVARKVDGSRKRGPGRPETPRVPFLIKLKTRKVHIAGISASPAGEWMKQVARDSTDAEDGFLGGITHLIRDRDPLYTGVFRRMLSDCGVKCLRPPARSPNLNACAERFVLSVKPECLDRIIPLSGAHLRRCVRQ